jgi:hypothetical protein
MLLEIVQLLHRLAQLQVLVHPVCIVLVLVKYTRCKSQKTTRYLNLVLIVLR